MSCVVNLLSFSYILSKYDKTIEKVGIIIYNNYVITLNFGGEILNKFEKFLSRYKLDFRLIKDIDKALLASVISLILYGILNIYLATKGNELVAGSAKKQFVWFIISMVALYFFVAIDYSVIYRYVPIFYWGSILLLIAVWIPGVGIVVNGARGWIKTPLFNIQPAEIAKFGIILMLAKLIDEMDGEVNNFKNFMKLAFYAALPVAFIVIQPDMGMSMVCFFIVFGIMFAAGLDKKVIYSGLGAIVLGIVILWNSGLIQDYQKTRFTAFLNPEADDSKSGYHLNQSLIGVGSGGILGSRPSFSKDAAMGYSATHVPEVQTDFIFSAIAEQLGLLGALFLLFLYGVLISKMVAIARSSKDLFGSIICAGMISYFLFAITQNIGMNIGLVPITGITLPLVSYGGSSLLTTVMAVALVLNVGMRRKKIHF